MTGVVPGVQFGLHLRTGSVLLTASTTVFRRCFSSIPYTVLATRWQWNGNMYFQLHYCVYRLMSEIFSLGCPPWSPRQLVVRLNSRKQVYACILSQWQWWKVTAIRSHLVAWFDTRECAQRLGDRGQHIYGSDLHYWTLIGLHASQQSRYKLLVPVLQRPRSLWLHILFYKNKSCLPTHIQH